MLVWGVADFGACLQTLPEASEYEISHSFTVAKDGLTLQIIVFQYDGDVAITLTGDGIERPVFEVTLFDCHGTRYVNDRRGEWLEFAPGRIAGNRNDGTSPLPLGISVSIRPGIQLRMFSQDM